MASFLTAAAAIAGSSGVGGALVRILVAYGISRLINKSTGADNSNATPVDQGIRLQVSPDTTNPIPLLYGSAYLGGKITDAQITDANKTMWYCLTIAENPQVTTRLSDGATVTTTVDEIYWNGQRVYFQADGITVDYIVNQDGVVDTSPRGLAKIYLYNQSSMPMLPSDLGEYITPLPAGSGDARTLMPGWVSDERMLNLTFALVKLSYNRDKNITGLPTLQFKVSNNLYKPGDAIHAYLRNAISGADFTNSQIDLDSLIALNNYADDTVSYVDEADGLTKTLGNRYQINGLINPQDNVMTNLQKLAGNSGCFLNYDIATGLWGVTLNKDETPVLAFNDSNIISGIDLTGTNLDNMYNAVEVEFPHRDLRDQMDTIRIDLPTEFRNSNEPDNVLKLRLDLINEPLQARELGYLELYQNRMDQVVTFSTDYSKINTEAGDVITITSSVYGWTNKPYRVIRVREVEGEDGGLAVEITAQEYDSTMYTAGGVPRRPRVPSEPIGIPDITVIGTPAAPTVVEFNNVAQPALNITGLTPSGIVDRFEFWYSSDSGATYKILSSRTNSTGAPYTQDTSLSFRAASLPAGTYLFKVRGGNEKAFGEFSAPSTSKTWAPVQVTDAVTAATTVGGGLSDLIGPLAMGAIAYFAYQALYPEVMKALGDSQIGELLGIPSSAVQEMKNAAGNFKLVQVGDVIQTPYNNDTITFVAGAGIEITAAADAGTITISANGTGAGVNTFNGEDGNIWLQPGVGCVITKPDPNDPKLFLISLDSSSIPGIVDACINEPEPSTTDFRVAAQVGNGVDISYTDYVINHLDSYGLPNNNYLRTHLPATIDGANAVFTHYALITGRRHSKATLYNGVWGGDASWYGQTNYNSYLYSDSAPIIFGGGRTHGVGGGNVYYSFCKYISELSLENQNWQDWTSAGTVSTLIGSRYVTLARLGTAIPGTNNYYPYPSVNSDCTLMIIGLSMSTTAYLPFKANTIFGTQSNDGTTTLTTPGRTPGNIGYLTGGWSINMYQSRVVPVYS